MRSLFFGMLFATTVLVFSFGAQDAPIRMTHIIAQMSGSGIAEDSFAAKPKAFWRASNRYCRVDEEPDPKNGIHGRIVMNEPDAWLINLEDNTAQHLVDPGPTYNCKLPMFALSQEMLKTKIADLEFGRELDFFRSNGAKRIDGPKLSFEANYYELPIGDSVLRLVERSDIHAPILVSLIFDGKSYVVKYSLWEEVPFQANLFVVPAGVKVKEPGQSTPSSSDSK